MKLSWCGRDGGIPDRGSPTQVRVRLRAWRLAALLLAMGWLLAVALPAAAQQQTVLRTQVAGTITPVIADHLVDAVAQAEQDGHAALLVELDTPGGLDTSMRQIVQAFLNAQVPVIVYVSPPGGRAASAGSIITSAANVAAMSPGTTIGSATPVDAQTGEKASDKIVNDAAAYAETIAAQRGRNTQFAAETVRDGRSATAEEALRIGAIDLVAADVTDLLQAADGRTVTLGDGTAVQMRTAGAAIQDTALSPLRNLLQILADPNLAFLFLSIGTLALIYELATPGMGLGGVIGAVMLILAFFSLSVLPVNAAGLALLALAAALFVAELFAPGIGVFAAGGVIALLFAGLFLFEGNGSIRVNPAVLWPTVIVVGAGVVIAGRLAWRARGSPPASGQEALVGRQIVIRDASGPRGRTQLDGAWWSVRTDDPEDSLQVGQSMRVVGVDGLILVVAPAQDERGQS